MADDLFKDENTKDVTENIKKDFEKGGMKEVKKQIEEKKDGWKKVSVNVGVVGRTGVGKSTFINTYRNIEYDDDPNAAPVGAKQTTKEAEPYPDPNNPNIILYDVPGVGTEEFPRSKYLKDPRVGIDKYDFIIIIEASRFTEDDIWLHEEMVRLQKPAFLLRTKVMQDVRNEMKRKKGHKDKTEEQVIKEIIDQYKSEHRRNTRVYYIDSHERDHPHLEFDDLLNDIVSSMSITKADAVLYSLQVYTPKLIKAKAESLKKRKWFISVISAAGAAISVPGISAPIDIALITAESEFYRNQLGLDKGILDSLKGRPIQAISTIINTWASITPKLIASLVTSEAAETATKVMLPIIGSIISAVISYGTTVSTLHYILKKMNEDAIKMNQLIIDSQQLSTKQS